MPADNMIGKSATGPSDWAMTGDESANPNPQPPPEAPYVELLAVDVATYAEVNTELAKVNVLIQYLHETGKVKSSADQ
jgi:hypothetical protein